MWIMFFISVFIAIPQIIGFVYLPLKGEDYKLNMYDTTLGNSGYSYMNKVVVPLRVDRVYIECDRTIIDDFSSQNEFDTYVGLIKPSKPDDLEVEMPIEDMNLIRTKECP
jgi:hypothetical protein